MFTFLQLHGDFFSLYLFQTEYCIFFYVICIHIPDTDFIFSILLYFAINLKF